MRILCGVRSRLGGRRALVAAIAAVSLLNATLLLRSLGGQEIAPTSAAEAAAPQRAPSGLPSAGSLVSVGKVAILGEDQSRQVRTATLFLSYYLISTRATTTLCAGEGVAIDAFTRRFADLHAGEYERASALLAPHGMNSELIWSIYGAQLETLAAGHVQRIATLDETGTRDACARIAEEAEQFAAGRRYAERFPELHASLMRP
jgi:hypothetical protein